MKKLKYQQGSEVRLAPQMPFYNGPAGIFAPQQVAAPQQTPTYTAQNKFQFGLNYGHIAQSQFAQGIAAWLRNKKIEKDDLAYQQAQSNPLLQIPFTPNTTQASQFGEQLLKKGGPSPAKAAEMLRDGTANKKPLTAKQKKYFQCIKHGGCKKEEGGPVEQEIEDEINNEIAAEDQVAKPVRVQAEAAPIPVVEDVEVDMSDPLEELAPLLDEDINLLSSGEPSTTGAGINTEPPAPSHIESFKNKIARTEGAGYFMPTQIKNEKGLPASSAYGKYQFTEGTRQKVRDLYFKEMSRDAFEKAYKTSPLFQEQVMDKYSGYLLNKFKDPKIAAKAFFLGEGRAYADDSYNPGGGNKSVGKYLKDAGIKVEGGIVEMKKGGIHIKKENKGKFTDYCGGKVTAECIKRGKNSSNPTTRKRATFAANARKWHQEGGPVHNYQEGGYYYLTDEEIKQLKNQGYVIE